MASWHKKLHKDLVAGNFIDTSMRCPATPDLWQIGIDFSEPPTPVGERAPMTYFLVQWRPPYIFRMAAISNRPNPACTEEDRVDDDEYRTLFAGQEFY